MLCHLLLIHQVERYVTQMEEKGDLFRVVTLRKRVDKEAQGSQVQVWDSGPGLYLNSGQKPLIPKQSWLRYGPTSQ